MCFKTFFFFFFFVGFTLAEDLENAKLRPRVYFVVHRLQEDLTGTGVIRMEGRGVLVKF